MDLQKYVSVDRYLPARQYLNLNNSHHCREKCPEKKCAYVCPAGVFELIDNYPVFHSERVCLECGACRLVCHNIIFDYPEAGRGVINHFG